MQAGLQLTKICSAIPLQHWDPRHEMLMKVLSHLKCYICTVFPSSAFRHSISYIYSMRLTIPAFSSQKTILCLKGETVNCSAISFSLEERTGTLKLRCELSVAGYNSWSTGPESSPFLLAVELAKWCNSLFQFHHLPSGKVYMLSLGEQSGSGTGVFITFCSCNHLLQT